MTGDPAYDAELLAMSDLFGWLNKWESSLSGREFALLKITLLESIVRLALGIDIRILKQ